MKPLRFLIFFSISLQIGCSHLAKINEANRAFYSSDYTKAAAILEKDAHHDGKNQLLFLLERATALFQAQEYQKSIEDFLLADKLAEIKDYTSLSAETASILVNDQVIDYKGEDFEKVLISQYLALNYLFLNKYEDAMVECRRVNHKISQLVQLAKRKYQLNPMAQYLTAILYEMNHEYSDAFIDYKNVFQRLPRLSYLKTDLINMAALEHRQSDLENFSQLLSTPPVSFKEAHQQVAQPELIIIIENGRAPEKAPHPLWHSIPHFVPQLNLVHHYEVSINNQVVGNSEILFDVETTAIENLDEKYATILAKRLTGVVAKEVIAHQIEERTDFLIGMLVRLGLYSIDQADLRSWQTLPKNFQIVRYRLPHKLNSINIELKPKDLTNQVINGMKPLLKTMLLTPNQTKYFVNFRL